MCSRVKHTSEVITCLKRFGALLPRERSPHPRLTTTQIRSADENSAEVHSTTHCEVKDLQLRVFYLQAPPLKESPIVLVPFRTLSITFRDTDKPEIDVQFAAVRFGGL